MIIEFNGDYKSKINQIIDEVYQKGYTAGLKDKKQENDNCISRQVVKELYYKDGYIDFRKICELPSVQPEITLESAIDYLHQIGWMQEHDRIMTESVQPERTGEVDSC